MRVRVKLYAALRRHMPPGTGEEGLVFELPEGATVSDLIGRLGFTPDHAGMVVSNDQHLELSSSLKDGQEVDIFPPLAGGCGDGCHCGGVEVDDGAGEHTS